MSNMKKEQGNLELKFEEVYIDANVFISSVIDLENDGNRARDILSRIKNGKMKAFTSTLTLDEVLWILQKKKDRDNACKAVEVFIGLPNLTFISVNDEIMRVGINIYKNGNLRPRDAIHLSCMKAKRLNIIISSDSDFDKIKGIERIDFRKVVFKEDNKE